MENKQKVSDILQSQSETVQAIIKKSLAIEGKYINKVAEREEAVKDIINMIKREVK